MGATVPAAVPTEGETAPATVSTEPAPVSAAVESVAEATSGAAPTPTPVETTTAAVEEQVTDVAASVAGSETTEQLKAVGEEATAVATAPVKSVADAANAQPTVEEVAGSVQPGVQKVVGSASSPVKQLPGEVAPALSPNAPSPDLPRSGVEDQTPAASQPPLGLPAPRIAGESPAPIFEDALPLETRPVAGWIDGLNLRGLFVSPTVPGPQAHGDHLASPSDLAGVVSGSHASPSGTPGHHPSPNGPGPAPGLSTSASPGPGGGSFFVPIAALLALLALAAPAISRRCKEALAAPVPSLFVCALERPG